MLEGNRRKAAGIGIALLALSFWVGWQIGQQEAEKKQAAQMLLQNLNTPMEQDEAAASLVVYVSGAVALPGIYEMPAEARVHEAIDLAQPREDANLDVIGMARFLEDGESLYVPSRNETEAEYLVNGGGTETLSSSGGKININQATTAELAAVLPGIGEVIAQRIVDYRTAHGKFNSIEEIKNVSGIGDKKYEAIVNLIKVR